MTEQEYMIDGTYAPTVKVEDFVAEGQDLGIGLDGNPTLAENDGVVSRITFDGVAHAYIVIVDEAEG